METKCELRAISAEMNILSRSDGSVIIAQGEID